MVVQVVGVMNPEKQQYPNLLLVIDIETVLVMFAEVVFLLKKDQSVLVYFE